MMPEFQDFDLENLQKLHKDIERQMLIFDEIVPYERQETAKIFSPRLLNMMLACGPQIEAVSNWIANKCELNNKKINIPNQINQINHKSALSVLEIFSTNHKLGFTPFTKEMIWWQAYNELKHDLTGKQFKLNYQNVMDALAALAGLHCMASRIDSNSEPRMLDLDGKKWERDAPFYKYKSLIFEIRVNQSTLRKIE